MASEIILTSLGISKLTNAISTNTPLPLTHIAVGDGGGSIYSPQPTQTALVNEKYRAYISDMTSDGVSKINLLFAIPQNITGFTLREIGVFDSVGDLIAVAQHQEFEKTDAFSIETSIILDVGNANAVTLLIDPNLAYVTVSMFEGHQTPSELETLTATSVTSSTATLSGRVLDFKDADPESTQLRIAYRKLNASTWSATAWTNHSTLSNFTASITGLETTTNYEFRLELKDLMRPSVTARADIKTFVTPPISSDVDSLINIEGGTTGAGVLAFDTTSVPTLTNASIVQNMAVASADGASATTKEFAQQVGQADWTQIKVKASMLPKKFTIVSGQTFPKNGITVTSDLDNLVTNGSKLLLGTNTTVTEVDVTAVTKTGSGGLSAGTLWVKRDSGTTNNLQASAYGNGLYLIGDSLGGLKTSTDGLNWTSRTSQFGTSLIYGITYGNGLFVAVGANGKLATSPDGITWTQRTSGVATPLMTVTYGNGLFVTGGGGGIINTSPDGVVWTKRNTNFYGQNIQGIAYGNGLFVAVGDSGIVNTSPDGITWTDRGAQFNEGNILSVAYGNGLFVGGSGNSGSGGNIRTSPDGITWTPRPSHTFGANAVLGITYANGLYVAVGYGGIINTSPDGINWTNRINPFTGAIWDATYGNGLFVAVGANGQIATSQQQGKPIFATSLYTGNDSTQTINNGIDLAGNGGMVWLKSRNNAGNNFLFDTSRGISKYLQSNLTNSEGTNTTMVTSVLSNGFTLGNNANTNSSANTYASWTFQEQAKFFTKSLKVHTNGTASTVDLSALGAVGMVLVKATTTSGDWYTWHRSLTAGNNLKLNLTDAQSTTNAYLSVSGTTLTIASTAPSATYVINAFSHDPSGVIQCGSYVGNGDNVNGVSVNLGWKPQYVLIKNASSYGDWIVFDSAIGVGSSTGTQDDMLLSPNLSGTEQQVIAIDFNSAGFKIIGANVPTYTLNTNGNNYIYMAIKEDANLPLNYQYECTTTQSITAEPEAVYKGGQKFYSSVTSSTHSFTQEAVSTKTRSGDIISLECTPRATSGKYAKIMSDFGNGDKISRFYAELFN